MSGVRAATPILSTDLLTKRFGDLIAVKNISIKVFAGEVYGFLGPNGAGKSTCVKMMTGLVIPTSGSGTIFGFPLGDVRAKKLIGYLPELFRFFSWLTAEEFLKFHLDLIDHPKREQNSEIDRVLELVDLQQAKRRKIGHYSKGMQQRIGIAQAIAGDPKLIFLDEPTSALDPLGRIHIRALIKQLKDEGRTVFLNSHLLSEIEMICDRVAIIDRGSIVRQGPLSVLLGGLIEFFLELNAVPTGLLEYLDRSKMKYEGPWSKDGRFTLKVFLSDSEPIPSIVKVVTGLGCDIYEASPKKMSLEDLFLKEVQN